MIQLVVTMLQHVTSIKCNLQYVFHNCILLWHVKVSISAYYQQVTIVLGRPLITFIPYKLQASQILILLDNYMS